MDKGNIRKKRQLYDSTTDFSRYMKLCSFKKLSNLFMVYVKLYF